MTLNDALHEWQQARRRSWSFKVAEYVAHLAKNWCVVLPAADVALVGVSDVERVEGTRDNGKRAAASLNQERMYLRSFFKWCRQRGYCMQDPTVSWRTRRAVVPEEYYVELSREVEEAVLARCEPWLRRFVVFAVETGMREGTIRSLRWEWIAEAGGVWWVSVPAQHMKARRSLRIPLTVRAKDALGERAAGGPVFDLPDATRVYRALKVAAAEVCPALKVHDLRRAFAARLLEKGVPVTTVMRLGAWSSQAVVFKHYYQRLSDAAALEAVR